jgi:hypothetical protein
MYYLLDVNAAREEHVHELAVGGTRAQLLNFRIPRITNLLIMGKKIADKKGQHATFCIRNDFFSRIRIPYPGLTPKLSRVKN